jgi:hypothetical protein
LHPKDGGSKLSRNVGNYSPTTQRHFPQHLHLHLHSHKNLKFRAFKLSLHDIVWSHEPNIEYSNVRRYTVRISATVLAICSQTFLKSSKSKDKSRDSNFKNTTRLLPNSHVKSIHPFHFIRYTAISKVLCYKSEGRWFDPRWCH